MRRLEETIGLLVAQRKARQHKMPRPCSNADIMALQDLARKQLGVCLPERYIDLLRHHNGFLENGLQFFASKPLEVADIDGSYFLEGIIKANEDLRADREGYDRFIVFGTEALYVHALDLVSGKYLLVPHDENWPSRLFDTFEEMAVSAIQREFSSRPSAKNHSPSVPQPFTIFVTTITRML